MKKYITVVLAILITIGAQAQITSTFDTDLDNWTAKNAGGTSATTNFLSSGGNPGGYASVSPPTSGGTVNTNLNWYWEAPAKFMGEHDLSYGQLLRFDLIQSVAGTDNSVSDVILISPTRQIHFTFPTKPGTTWTTYEIPLDITADWRINAKSGAKARHYHIKEVLANITKVQIRCKYSNTTGHTTGIDNVAMYEKILEAAPVITSFSPLKGLPETIVTISGNNFNTNAANNIVYFGGVKTAVETATATTLTVKVPSSASRGQISVLNTTKLLTGTSSMEFQPLYNNDNDFGGRIIPATFGENVKIPVGDFNDNGIDGAHLADFDGDALLDVVTLEGARKFAFFRNLGLKGDISDNSFAPKFEIPSGDNGQGNANCLEVADFDNDGKNDVATFSRGIDDNIAFGGGIAVTRNISTPGNFAFETAVRFFYTTIYCSDIRAEDIDGDGRKELLVTSGSFAIARNISTPGHIEFAAMRGISNIVGAITTGDINGDGKADVIVTSGSNYYIFENQSTPGNISLAAPVIIAGSIVSGVTITDLDNDQKPDLLLYRGNSFNNYSFIIRKNIHSSGAIAAGSFGPDIIFSTIGRAYSQFVADVNGDSKPEILIIANSGSAGNGFVVFENVGEDGVLNEDSFMPEVYFEETAVGTLAIPRVGDIDGDNKPDIVTFGSSDGGDVQITLYKNKSTRTPHISLQTVSPLSGPVGSIVTITGEDFSTDPAKLTVKFGAVKANIISSTLTEIKVEVPVGATYDVVSVTRDFRTSRYHLPFSPTFTTSSTLDATSFHPPVNFTLTGADYDVAVGDINNDGKPDVMAESFSNVGFFQFFGNTFVNQQTTGAITTASLSLENTTGNNANNPRLLDIDEDGQLDFVAGGGIYRNTSTTSAVNFDPGVTGPGGTWQAWGDFDLDGKTDIVSDNSTIIQIRRNHSMPRAFRLGPYATFAPNINFSKPGSGGACAVGDFDSDGLPDIAASAASTDNIRIWRNTGGFPLTAAQFTVVPGDIPAGDNPGRLYVGDFDLDGKIDMVTYHNAGTSAAQISVFHNTSTTGNISFTKTDYALGAASGVIAIADLDGDGKPDIIVVGETAGRVSVFKNTSTPGTIDASSFTAPIHFAITGPRGLAAADLNGDGKPEIIVTRSGGLLSVMENALPTGPSINIATQPAPTAVCEGSSAVFTVEASGTTNITYQWQKYNGTAFTDLTDSGGFTGTTTKSLTVNTATTSMAGATDYRVRMNGDNVTERISQAAGLAVNALPATPVTTGGSKCVSPTTFTLTATGATNGNYRWFDVATGGNVLGTNSTFTTPAIAVTTTYYVSTKNTLCESVRVPVTAEINLVAKPSITSTETIANGEIDICDGESTSLSAPPGFVKYTWSNGASTQQIVATNPGSYTVQVEAAGGCTSPASDPVKLNINAFPDAIITVDGTQLIASQGDTYQWYQNGDLISGATTQSFTFSVLEYGAYTVDVTTKGCKTTSDEFIYLITGEEERLGDIRIFPNPFTDYLRIETKKNQAYEGTVIDMLGRSVRKFSGTGNALVQTSDVPAGTYYIIIHLGYETKFLKILKLK